MTRNASLIKLDHHRVYLFYAYMSFILMYIMFIAVLSESDGEDRIITVHTDETHRSSYSDSSTAGDKNTNNHNLPSHVHSPRNG